MAAPARILSLNLGTQTVGLAEFQRADNGGLALNAYKLTEILSDPSAEAARLPQTRLAIAEMKDALKLKGGPVNYAISGQNIFARFVKLPTVAEDKIDQIIGFEAQQNVPFPIEEVIWDYQLVGSGKEGQVEVVLVAIKSDLLDDLNATSEGNGFRTQIVDAAPMALYNAFRYNYSDLPGCTLLIDLGARTTNLVFVETGKVFSRSINIGGNTITANLAKEFQESFSAAEDRKKRDGYVSLGGAYADDKNADIAKAAKIIRNAMTRLHAEISRSINFYRAQQAGTAPQRIFLCGGTANLPYLREFFAEKFQLPIEYFNPLKNVTVTGNVNVDEVVRNAHLLGELVGLGLRSVNTCPMELNLRPTSVINAEKTAARRPYFVGAGVCLLLALLGTWLYFLRADDLKTKALAEVRARNATMGEFEKQNNAVIGPRSPRSRTTPPRSSKPSTTGSSGRGSSPGCTSPAREIHLGDPARAHFRRQAGRPGRSDQAAGAGRRPATRPPRAAGPRGHRQQGTGHRRRARPRALPRKSAGRQRGHAFVKNLSDKNPGTELFNIDKTNENSVIKNRSPQTNQDWAFDYDLQINLKDPLTVRENPEFRPRFPLFLPKTMDWIRKNKFLAGFLGFIIVADRACWATCCSRRWARTTRPRRTTTRRSRNSTGSRASTPFPTRRARPNLIALSKDLPRSG